MFSKKHIVSLSLVTAFAVNSLAYEATLNSNDGGNSNNIAIGEYSNATSASDSSISIGLQSNATGVNSLAIGSYANAIADNSVAIGLGARANESNVVSFGRGVENGDLINNYARLVNVADPINLHDAVNLNYLNTTLSSYYTKTQVDTLLAGLSVSGSSVDLSNAYTYTDTKASQTLQNAKAYTDEQITEAKKEARAGVALALALSTPLDFLNGKSAMNIGTGYYKGESAIGLNFGRKVNDYTHYTFGIAKSSSEQAFKASVGFSW